MWFGAVGIFALCVRLAVKNSFLKQLYLVYDFLADCIDNLSNWVCSSQISYISIVINMAAICIHTLPVREVIMCGKNLFFLYMLWEFVILC